jgi:hypothetical protein
MFRVCIRMSHHVASVKHVILAPITPKDVPVYSKDGFVLTMNLHEVYFFNGSESFPLEAKFTVSGTPATYNFTLDVDLSQNWMSLFDPVKGLTYNTHYSGAHSASVNGANNTPLHIRGGGQPGVSGDITFKVSALTYSTTVIDPKIDPVSYIAKGSSS